MVYVIKYEADKIIFFQNNVTSPIIHNFSIFVPNSNTFTTKKATA